MTGDSVDDSGASGDGPPLDEADVDAVVAGMRAGAERIERRELDRALSRLEHHGDLDDAQRAAVEELADALVSHLLAPPIESLRAAAAAGEWETVATAVELFDPGEDGSRPGIVDAERVEGVESRADD